MSSKVVIFAAVVSVVLADYGPPKPSPRAPAPSYGPPPSASYGPTAPARYDFEYEVKDRPSSNDFGHQESRNGDNTEGSYFVLLPDGRMQRVTYEVNGDSGYLAEVTYEGEARYPQHQASSSSGYGNNNSNKPKSSSYA